jgi:hypothetical protein
MKSPRSSSYGSAVPEWVPLLVAAIVQQAISDAFDPSLPPAVRREARRFLSGSADYRFWGQVAEGRTVN